MYNDRRKDLRLPASLKVEVRKDKIEHITGLITEFSRNGLRAVFNDDFKFSPNSCVDLKIERPSLLQMQRLDGYGKRSLTGSGR